MASLYVSNVDRINIISSENGVLFLDSGEERIFFTSNQRGNDTNTSWQQTQKHTWANIIFRILFSYMILWEWQPMHHSR